MNELSLFSGAGGGLLGTKLLGFKCVGCVEQDEYCQRVLRARIKDGFLDDAPIFSDVRTFNGLPYRGRVDIVTAGFPCQPFSTASRGNITAIDLWPETLRVITEVQPRFVFAENVSKRAIEAAAESLAAVGYDTRAVALSASDLGADHIRRRYWLLAYTDNESELPVSNDAEVGRMSQFRESVWESYPAESGVANGVANRMDRFRAIGNGQVPRVVVEAFRQLTDCRAKLAAAEGKEGGQ